MVEVAASAKDRPHGEDLKSLGDVIRSSLSCAPADPFLWLALYWVEVTENGSKPDYLNYLRLSYQLGPHEGWIVLKRNPLAFGAFQQLPPDLRENVIDEFVAMVRDSRFSDQAADILIGPAWPERDLILPHLTQISEYDRKRFADVLYGRGYVNVPGIGLEPRDSHVLHQIFVCRSRQSGGIGRALQLTSSGRAGLSEIFQIEINNEGAPTGPLSDSRW